MKSEKGASYLRSIAFNRRHLITHQAPPPCCEICVSLNLLLALKKINNNKGKTAK